MPVRDLLELLKEEQLREDGRLRDVLEHRGVASLVARLE